MYRWWLRDRLSDDVSKDQGERQKYHVHEEDEKSGYYFLIGDEQQLHVQNTLAKHWDTTDQGDGRGTREKVYGMEKDGCKKGGENRKKAEEKAAKVIVRKEVWK